jgi:hypothetical protein
MRSELAALLRLQRIQQRGPRATLIPAGGRALEDLSLLIQQYRNTILAWCRSAADTAATATSGSHPPTRDNPFRGGGRLPAISELRGALAGAYAESTAGRAGLDQLSAPQNNPAAEHWRQAARAAALAEQDTNGAINAERLTRPQALALVGDVAIVTQALVVLDQRYRNTPAWETLGQPGRLGWIALACALETGLQQPDYSIDRTGWEPPTNVIVGPARPGVAGVLQAENNLLANLDRLPTALNLRRVVDSQRILTAKLEEILPQANREFSRHWQHRSETYHRIQRHLRDVGGLLGSGGVAAAEGANAVGRSNMLPPDSVLAPLEVDSFQDLFTRIDVRIAESLEFGFQSGAYFQRVTLPRLIDQSQAMIQPARERFAPISEPANHPAVQIARTQASSRIVPAQLAVAQDRSRADLVGDLRRGSDAPSGLTL